MFVRKIPVFLGELYPQVVRCALSKPFSTIGDHAGNFSRIHSQVRILAMPQLSPTMTEGKIVKWLVKPNQWVSSYDLGLEVSTNNLTTESKDAVSNMEIEILEDMFVAQITALEGEIVPVGFPIAILCENAADIEAIKNYDVSLFTGTCTSSTVTIGATATESPRTGGRSAQPILTHNKCYPAMWQAYIKSKDDVGAACGC